MITDVIDLIKTAAIAMDFRPVLADPNSIQYEIQQLCLVDSENVLYIRDDGFQLQKTDQMYNGDINYSLSLLLCRKSEAETVSSVSETFQQKYDNRLKDLKELMITFLGTKLLCSNDIEVMTNNCKFIKNIFSVNVDGVNCDLTIQLINQYGEI
jgi:hypothetical protein